MSFFKNIKTENIELKLPFLKDDGFEIFMKERGPNSSYYLWK